MFLNENIRSYFPTNTYFLHKKEVITPKKLNATGLDNIFLSLCLNFRINTRETILFILPLSFNYKEEMYCCESIVRDTAHSYKDFIKNIQKLSYKIMERSLTQG